METSLKTKRKRDSSRPSFLSSSEYQLRLRQTASKYRFEKFFFNLNSGLSIKPINLYVIQVVAYWVSCFSLRFKIVPTSGPEEKQHKQDNPIASSL